MTEEQAYTEGQRVLLVAARLLEEAGLTVAPELIRDFANSELTEYVERAVQLGIANEKRKLEIANATYRRHLRQEYAIADAVFACREPGDSP